jgi:hypothetical protein
MLLLEIIHQKEKLLLEEGDVFMVGFSSSIMIKLVFSEDLYFNAELLIPITFQGSTLGSCYKFSSTSKDAFLRLLKYIFFSKQNH